MVKLNSVIKNQIGVLKEAVTASLPHCWCSTQHFLVAVAVFAAVAESVDALNLYKRLASSETPVVGRHCSVVVASVVVVVSAAAVFSAAFRCSSEMEKVSEVPIVAPVAVAAAAAAQVATAVHWPPEWP